MPPSGYDEVAVEAIVRFTLANYEALERAWRSGKFKSFEEAITFEIGQLRKAIKGLHINKNGRLVRRGR